MALHPFALAAVLTALSLGIHAQTNPEGHAAHHPDGTSASAVAAPAPVAVASASPAGPLGAMNQSARMHEHMNAMCEMHEKMAKARTPSERDALMAEHMKLMHEGMSKMDGMKGMGAMTPQGGAAASPEARMQALERRMDMMQMMMDRMPTGLSDKP